MGAEPQINIMVQHDDFHKKINKRRLRASWCIRFLSILVFIKLAFTLGGFAYLSLRSSHPVTLSPFETHEVRFCPSWFRGVDIVAPFPSNEYVTVHKFKGRPNVTAEHETYRVGYDLELKAGQFGRTHSRSYHFPANTMMDLEFESSTPVNFFLVHPEHRQHKNRVPRGEHGEDRAPAPHHGHSGYRHGHHGHRQESQTEAQSNERQHQVASTRKEFQIAASEGRYDIIFSLPKNSTGHARVAVRIAASVKTIDISHSCPMRSSLSRGHKHVRLNSHQREHVVLAASPYARTSSLVYVRLIPREHKFAVVSGILFAVYIVLRLIARYLRAHSGVAQGQGKCFWSRLCGKKNNNVQYSAVPQNPQIEVVYPGQH